MTVPNVTKKKEGKKEVNWPRGCYSFSSSFFSFSLTKTKLTKTLLKLFSSGKPGNKLGERDALFYVMLMKLLSCFHFSFAREFSTRFSSLRREVQGARTGVF